MWRRRRQRQRQRAERMRTRRRPQVLAIVCAIKILLLFSATRSCDELKLCDLLKQVSPRSKAVRLALCLPECCPRGAAAGSGNPSVARPK